MARRQARARIMASQPAPAAPGGIAISSAGMDEHLARGQAVPLSQVVPFIVRYQDTWWLSTRAGWLPIASPIAAVLDKHADRMRHHDVVIAANQATIRTVIARAREAASHQDQSPG